ncbi:SAMC protein, partial [Polypterus senegalus]|nr:SAMC protein [Polypterus senegalus]
MCVDLVLYPLDTIKTRLQSPQGFFKASGFRGIYAGVPSVAVGSFPSASAFFVTYEYFKSALSTFTPPYLNPVIHMVSASLGEMVACVIRVPTEVVKQRTQASPSTSTYRILLLTLREEPVADQTRSPPTPSLRVLQGCLGKALQSTGGGLMSHTFSSFSNEMSNGFALKPNPGWVFMALLDLKLAADQICPSADLPCDDSWR